MCPILGLNSLGVFVLFFFRLRDLEKSLFSKSPTYTSYKYAPYCLALSLLIYLDNELRSGMELEPKTLDLAKSVIKRAAKRGFTTNRSKINPWVVRRKLQAPHYSLDSFSLK